MADLTFTPANVLFVDGPIRNDVVSGGAFATGDIIALDSDNTWKAAECDGTAYRAGSTEYGIALFTSAAAGARGAVAQIGARVNYGAIFTMGILYYLSAAAGKVCPVADLVSTNRVVGVLLPTTTSIARLVRCYDDLSIKP